MADDDLLNDSEIQKLLAAAQGGGVPEDDPAETSPSSDEPAASAGSTAVETAEPPGAAEDSEGADNLIGSSEIEALLAQSAGGGGSPAAPAQAASSPATPAPSPSPQTEQLLNEVEAGIDAALADPVSGGRSNVVPDLEGAEPYQFSEFGNAGAAEGRPYSLGMLDDVELDLQIELGRADLRIDEVLQLRTGAVVPLDRLAGDPVDIVVNGRVLARGEVLVLNDCFCVRIAEIVSTDF